MLYAIHSASQPKSGRYGEERRGTGRKRVVVVLKIVDVSSVFLEADLVPQPHLYVQLGYGRLLKLG
jgi:hypothetical protein